MVADKDSFPEGLFILPEIECSPWPPQDFIDSTSNKIDCNLVKLITVGISRSISFESRRACGRRLL